MKAASQESHHIWVDADRPRTGLISDNHLACRAQYKKAIRAALVFNERKINYHLMRSLLNCDSKEFWHR